MIHITTAQWNKSGDLHSHNCISEKHSWCHSDGCTTCGVHNTVSGPRDVLTWKQNARQSFLIEAAKNSFRRKSVDYSVEKESGSDWIVSSNSLLSKTCYETKSKRVDDCGNSLVRIVLWCRSSFVGDNETFRLLHALLLHSIVTNLPMNCTIRYSKSGCKCPEIKPYSILHQFLNLVRTVRLI